MNAGLGFSRFIQMLFILVLGGRDPDPGSVATDNGWAVVPREALAHIEFNMSELTTAARTLPELKRVLAVTSDYDVAAADMGRALGAEPAAVKEAFSGVRRIGFWRLGVGRSERNFRYLFVIDRGKREDVLPKLIKDNPKLKPPADARRRAREGYIATTYNGVTIHALRSRRGINIWVAEREGKLAIGSDRFAIQSFLLRSMSGGTEKKQDKETT